MYTDISSTKDYPKTLIIRNQKEGMIWQVYHVQNKKEADILSSNAHKKAFYAITLERHQPEIEETWPDWRETEGWIKLNNK